MAKILFDKRILWLIFAGMALAILLHYVWSSWQAGQGNLLMPLDDVYIHFQYARQMALGHPYQYNLSDPPTSGATSFIYPYLLAFGYLIGFQGLWLGLWAMLLGAIALLAALWAVYRLGLALELSQWLSLIIALAFGLSGANAWHFMSGMETGLMMAFCLWTLLFVVEKRLNAFVITEILLSITRPEGGALAALAAATMLLRLWKDFAPVDKNRGKRWQLALLLLPILAIGIQPLVNLLITGTSVATGNQAKSILATIPQDWGLILTRVLDNFGRMWLELFTGFDGREGRGWYLPALIGGLGLAALPMLFLKKNMRLVALMLLGWALALTAAVSTLDTAFWHFKRYQMPLLALLFPLGAWGLHWLTQRFPKLAYAYGVILLIFSAALYAQFLHYYSVNVGYVYQQPYQMALWLRENTPTTARIAVHDVGLMRYMGERETLDMVGLTTPNAAAYWRNGVGSVAEFLMNERPDYIASYGRGHGYGLAYLADTSLYANQLASFVVPNWQREINVALAADSQGIYQPEWDLMALTDRIPNNANPEIEIFNRSNSLALDFVNVADIASETAHNYSWTNAAPFIGFSTEVYEFGGVIDGLRRINHEERFTINTSAGYDGLQFDAILVSRVHAQTAGTVDIYLNEQYLDTQWIPADAGQWFNIITVIPQALQSSNSEIRIVPNMPNGYYQAAIHEVHYAPDLACCDDLGLASFQNERIHISVLSYGLDSMNLNQFAMGIGFLSDGNAEGDYRLFVHLSNDRNQAPLAQWDGYVSGLPIGNWLKGTMQEGIVIDIADLPNGTYELAIGFYNPQNPQDRLMPESDVYEVTADGRLWLGEVEINR